jgi:hypothetical protein
MKIILLPVTLLIWYFLTYYGLYFSVLLILMFFSLHWLWIILLGITLITFITYFVNGIAGIIKLKLLSFYNHNQFFIIAHSISGLVASINIILYLYNNPPVIGNIGDSESNFFLSKMWEISPFKTIILFPTLIGILFSIVWTSIISSFFLKDVIEKENES